MSNHEFQKVPERNLFRFHRMQDAAEQIQMAYRRYCFRRGVRRREYETRLREKALKAEQVGEGETPLAEQVRETRRGGTEHWGGGTTKQSC